MGHNQDGKAWPTTRKITGHGDEKWTDQKRKEKRARFSRKGLCGRFFSWPSFIGFGGLFCFSSDDFIDTILDQESANCPHQRMLEGCCSCVPVSNNDYWRVSAPASRPRPPSLSSPPQPFLPLPFQQILGKQPLLECISGLENHQLRQFYKSFHCREY